MVTQGRFRHPCALDVASISEEIAGAIGASIGRAIRASVEAWKKTATSELARRVRAWRRETVGRGTVSLEDLARELAALRGELVRRPAIEGSDPGAVADRIASALAAHLGGRLSPVPPPPPAAEPKERERIPFDDIAGIVDRLIRQQG